MIVLRFSGPQKTTLSNIPRGGNTVVASVIGPPGVSGSAGNISNDAGNQLTTGTDSGLYVPPIGQLDLGTFN